MQAQPFHVVDLRRLSTSKSVFIKLLVARSGFTLALLPTRVILLSETGDRETRGDGSDR